MKTLKVAVCDDDKEILGVISGAIQSAMSVQGFVPEVYTFTEGEALIEAVGNHRIQLVLLDIEMPKMDGIQIGQRIREIDSYISLIYVSENESKVFEAFQAEPLCFVRKSRFLSDLAVAANLFRKTYERNESDYVEFTAKSGILTLKANDILYIEGQRNYQTVFLAANQKTEELKMTMERLEDLLLDKGFIRIHKGFLVNHSYIQRIDGLELSLRDGTALPIARSRLEDVKTRYIRMMQV